MASPFHTLLAESLSRAKQQANRGVLQSQQLGRVDRERLLQGDWLMPVIKGWYLLKQPASQEGDATRWYSSFWDFLAVYLTHRFGDDYCLTVQPSLDIHLGSTTIPKQVLVSVKKGGSSIITLPFNTSVCMYQQTDTFPLHIEKKRNLNILPLSVALIKSSADFYQKNPDVAEIALNLIKPTELTHALLESNNLAAAHRLVGAFEFIKKEKVSEQIQRLFKAAGFTVKPHNPFKITQPKLQLTQIKSPYAARIKSMWQSMRDDVIAIFPELPGLPRAKVALMKDIDEQHIKDAYHSLSIEGYEVSEELIKKISDGKWSPEDSLTDREQINAMAAKGYLLAFQTVKKSIEKFVFAKKNPGKVVAKDLSEWFLQLFSPAVQSGLLEAKHLAGFRHHQVYIRGSMHTPLPVNALVDAMEVFFDCMVSEEHPAVRAVLGHFIFVFIHPYMDGNGRLARFIMNGMLVSGGYPWAIIKVQERAVYFAVLEKASVTGDIKPFAKFVVKQMI